jgi:hypothetical protein
MKSILFISCSLAIILIISAASCNSIKELEYKGIKNPKLQTLSFNNTARLYIPNNLDLRTHTINNNIINQSKFIDITFSKYKLNNMLLINSWNEWGEDMAIEETESNNKLLNLIKFKLLKFIHQDELMIQ